MRSSFLFNIESEKGQSLKSLWYIQADSSGIGDNLRKELELKTDVIKVFWLTQKRTP